MMKRFIYLLCFCINLTAWAHKQDDHLVFIPNQGQWQPKQIAFQAPIKGGMVFLTPEAWVFNLMHQEDIQKLHPNPNPEKVPIRHHAFEMRFLQAHPTLIQGEEKESYYHNYFLGNDPQTWASNVPVYEGVTYKNLYPNIDVKVYSQQLSLKYDFIVHPQANPNLIQIQYSGLNGLSLKHGNLHLQTEVGELIEQRPYAYQVIDGKKQEVACEFVLKQNVLSYTFPKGYQAHYAVVIDPVLVFASYTGSTSDNWGYTATYDATGNLYSGGVAFAAGYPVTLGAFQSTWAGTFSGDYHDKMDISISKFNNSGTNLLYSTYLGGTLKDQPHSLIVNDNNELHIMGSSTSIDFPTTSNAYDKTFNGGLDIILVKMNANGTALLGSTYLGGSAGDGTIQDATASVITPLYKNYGDDVRGEVIVDVFGNWYVATSTGSLDIPTKRTTLNAFNGGTKDGYVFKMNSDCSDLLWASYLGGSGDDGLYGICFGKDSAIVVCGGTTSTSLPAHNTALHKTLQGGTDGFIATFADTALTKLSYIGTSAFDQTYFVQTDKSGNIYTTGQTLGAYPTVGGVFSQANGAQFISKFDPDLSTYIYSSRFGAGTSINISPSAFLVDKCEQVYVSGWGGGANSSVGNTLGLITTANATQNVTDGQDFYLIVYQTNAVALLYAGFFGGNNNLANPSSGEHVDGGTSRFDKNGIVYQAVCAGCWANSVFPASTGAWSMTNGSGGCNNAVFKFDFQLSNPVLSQLSASPNNGCVPLTVTFDNTSQNGLGYFWDFGDGNTSTTMKPTHTFTQAGTYIVMLVVDNINSCNKFDTAYVAITVHPLPSVPNATQNVCDPTAILDAGNPGSTYDWYYMGNPVGNTQTITASSSGVYNVTIVSPYGCVRKDSITLTFYAPPTAAAPKDTTTCIYDPITLVGSSTGASSVQWTFNSSVVSSTNTYNAVSTGWYVFQSTNSVGCIAKDSVYVNYLPIPKDSLATTFTLCANSTLVLDAKNVGSTYTWTHLGNPVGTNQTYSPSTSGQYQVLITNSAGCFIRDTVTVNFLPIPSINPIADTVLCNQTPVLFAPTISGASSYTWYYNGNPIGSGSSIVATNAGTYVIQASNAACSTLDTIQLSYAPLPKDSLVRTLTFCSNDSKTLDAKNVGSTYTWTYLGNTVGTNQTYTPTASGQYEVLITNSFGCMLKDTINITIVPAPAVNLPVNDTLCVGKKLLLQAGNSGATYQWYKDKINLNHNFDTLTVTQNGIYQVVVTNGNLCSNADSIQVMFIEPKARLGADTCLCKGNTLKLYSGNVGMSYLWQPSNLTTSNITIQESGTYTLTVTSPDGQCSDTDVITVDFLDCAFTLPNIFTPNEDQLNDLFEYDVKGWFEYSLTVFNRWGNVVYETNTPQEFWNGKEHNNGIASPEGVYYGVIVAKNCAGKSIRKSFNVTLLR